MSDEQLTPTPQHEGDVASAAALSELTARVRRHRIWLTVLTILVVLGTLAMCAAGGLYAYTFSGFGGVPMTIDEEQVETIRQEFEDGYGPMIDSLDVRVVEVDYGSPGFPYSLFGSPKEESVYVECALKGGITIADVVPPYGFGATETGMIPTKGSLKSRMTTEQLEALLEAFAAETRSPLGAVHRYNDQPELMYSGTTPPETVFVSGTEYRTAELWAAIEGTRVKGDRVDMANSNFMRTALIFHEDPATGEFTFLGTESVSSPW